MVVAKQSKLQARTVDLLEVAEELVAYFDYCRRTGTYGALYDPGHWEPLRDAIDSAREALAVAALLTDGDVRAAMRGGR